MKGAILQKVSKNKLRIQNDRVRILNQNQGYVPLFQTSSLAPNLQHNQISRQSRSFHQEDCIQPKARVKFRDSIEKSEDEPSQRPLFRARRTLTKLKQQSKHILKKSFSTSKMLSTNKNDETRQNSAPKFIQWDRSELIIQLLETLKKQLILIEQQKEIYLIKKEDISAVFEYLISTILEGNDRKIEPIHKKFPNIACIQNISEKIRDECQEYLKNSLSIFRIDTKKMMFEYGAKKYEEQARIKQGILEDISIELNRRKQQLKTLREDQFQLQMNIRQNKEKFREQLRFHSQLSSRISEMKNEEFSLAAQLKKVKTALKSSDEEYFRLTNFIKQENIRVLGVISQQFKKIEQDMYDYAIHLQSTQLASQLDYESYPFSQIEEMIIDEMQTVNKVIMEDDEVAPEYKTKLMRDFVIRAMEKYKKKNQQLMGMNQFKTKCIQKFIANMKRWLDNWTLKQQYLGSLRKQFVIDSMRIRQKFKILHKNWQTKKDYKSDPTIVLTKQIENLSDKIFQNYQLGNSFY